LNKQESEGREMPEHIQEAGRKSRVCLGDQHVPWPPGEVSGRGGAGGDRVACRGSQVEKDRGEGQVVDGLKPVVEWKV
jgi:hypothetical protein